MAEHAGAAALPVGDFSASQYFSFVPSGVAVPCVSGTPDAAGCLWSAAAEFHDLRGLPRALDTCLSATADSVSGLPPCLRRGTDLAGGALGATGFRTEAPFRTLGELTVRLDQICPSQC